MPTLRISFPETDSPAIVALRGTRITIGRLPQNTIQIRDRTLSAFHAELIEEGDHYRLHDTGATNGILVNGEPVTDYHLREACKVTFGGVECEFNPTADDEAQADPSLALMTRGECEQLRTKNADLSEMTKTLREEINLLSTAGNEDKTASLDHALVEACALKETLSERDREIKQLRADLALLQRDRTNLERALKEAQEGPSAHAESKAVEPAPKAPVEAPVAAAPVATPKPAVPVARAVEKVAPWAPNPPTPKATPAAAPVPAPLPKPSAPLPHATPQPKAVPAAPAAAPAVAATPKVPVRLQPAAVANATHKLVARPVPKAVSQAGSPSIPQTVPKPSAVSRPATMASGPEGTQRISV